MTGFQLDAFAFGWPALAFVLAAFARDAFVTAGGFESGAFSGFAA